MMSLEELLRHFRHYFRTASATATFDYGIFTTKRGVIADNTRHFTPADIAIIIDVASRLSCLLYSDDAHNFERAGFYICRAMPALHTIHAMYFQRRRPNAQHQA